MNNIPEYSVTELNLEIKIKLEKKYEYICVKGECGFITIAKSGHAYFSIKEEDEVISCICWKGNLEKQEIKLEDSVEYNFFGKITSFAKSGRSGYQLILDRIEYSGQGSILKLINDRKNDLEKLGYFDAKNKLKIPKYPENIIVVTSPTGAVIRDIIQRVKERFPIAKITLFPIAVQGKNAHLEIIRNLELIEQNSESIEPSVIILARGGGSLEEMMTFNEIDLVKKIFNCKFPIISAIGHETDFTLTDYVSDLRAATPTAAAELATPNKDEILMQIKYQANTFKKQLNLIYNSYNYRMSNFSNKLDISNKKIFSWGEKINLLYLKQLNLYKDIFHLKKQNINDTYGKININNPIQKIHEKKKYIKNYNSLLDKLINSKLKKYLNNIEFQGRLIINSSLDKNLKKGYALILNKNKLIKSKKNFDKNKIYKIKFNDGETNYIKK